MPSRIRAALYCGLTCLFSVLPLPLMVLLGTALGELAYWCHAPRRRITERNLRACFPARNDAWVRMMARQHFHHMAISIFTIALAWWAPRGRLRRLCRVENAATLARIVSAQEPIILLAPHFTSLEYTGMLLFSQRPMSTMYRRHKNPYLDRLITQRRQRYGGRLFNDKTIAPAMIKSLRRGIPLYYLPDQDPGRNKGIFVDFYGIPTATYPVLGRLARLGNAVVIPCMARLRPWGTGFDLILGAPLADFPSGNEAEDALVMNRHIEQLIAHAPEQYFWSHRRFKTRPENAPPFYS